MQPIERPGRTGSSLESIFWFASSNFFRQGMSAATTLLRPVLMSPELFGLFTALRLIPTYAEYLHLGSRDSMRYLIPLHEAKNEPQRIDRLRATVLSFTMMGALVLSLVLFAVALLSDFPTPERIGLAICGVAVLGQALYGHFFTELKGFQAFREVGLNNYLNAVLQLGLNLVLILSLGFYGALLATVGVSAGLMTYMLWRGTARPAWGFDWGIFKSAILLGGPSMLFDLTLVMMRSTDRLVILNTLGYEQLGYYGLGAMVMGFLMNIPGATREVMEARIFQNHDGSQAAAFASFVLRPMVMMGLTMPVLIGPVVLFLPVFIDWILPKYVPAVPSTQILMIGGYFLAVSYPIRGILAANGWQLWGAAMVLGSVVLHVGVSSLLITLGLGITGVAISAGLSFASACLALFLFVAIRLPQRPAGWIRQGLLALLPFPLMLAVLYGVMRFGDWLRLPAWQELLLQFALYGLFLLVGGAVAAWSRVLPLGRLGKRSG